MTLTTFQWPHGARAALSLSFDDARPSQLDHGIALLNQFGIKGTFYLSLEQAAARRDDWRAAAAAGHEIGNHTSSHPCSANFEWARPALEDMSIEQIEQDILGASEGLCDLFGIRPRTFAYPCGQSYVGRGEERRSYVPVIARHFEVGRGYNTESDNDPLRCDLSAIEARALDGADYRWVERRVRSTLDRGRWLVLAGHETASRPGPQTTKLSTLEKLCRLAASQPALWVATVAEVGAHVRRERSR
jgi:peptidoglycan/xylan/chitin deacetylase (PgdA/CDA1 family)